MMDAFNQTRQVVLAHKIERANTMFKRMKGLLGKKEMPNDYGLWLDPGNSIHTFFMKFPIDVVFLSSNHDVVKILNSIRPFRMSSLIPSARSILELASGSVESTGTNVGDHILFRLQ